MDSSTQNTTAQLSPNFLAGQKVTLLLASTLTIMSAAIIAPSLPQMAHVFRAVPNAEFVTKLVLTLPTIFIALSAPIAGRFIDKHGRTKLLLWALLAYAITGSSGYFLGGLFEILAGRALLGITIGVLMTTTTTLVGDYFEGDERKKFVGTQVAFISFGGVVFLAMGGYLADISWRTPFLIYGASLLIIPLSWTFLKEPKARIGAIIESPNGPPFTPFYLLFGATFVVWVLFFMIPVQIPFLLKGLDINRNMMIGAAVATNTGFAAIASLMYSRIKSRMNFPTVYAFGLAIMAVGYCLVWNAGTFAGVQLGMVFSGVGIGLIIPNTNLWIIQRTPESIRGREIGRLTTFRFMGQFCSPIILYPIAHQYGLPQSFLVASIVIALISIFFLTYNKIHKNYGTPKHTMASEK